MRAVFMFVLVIGLGLAGFAAWLAKQRFDQYQAALAQVQAKAKPQVPLAPVAIVKRKVEYGDVLRPEDIAFIPYARPAIPKGAFGKMEEIFPEGERLPRQVLRPMEEGEVLLAVKVTEPGEDAGVATRLSRGMRAFAIRVDVASGVSGFLRPGDRVDVFWTGEISGRRVTKLIQQGVRLIAVDQIADTDRSAPVIARTVTVEATPEQVALLAQAQATGKLSLSLVGTRDDTIVSSDIEVDNYELLGIERQAPVQAEEARPVCTVRTRKGAELVEIPIPCTQ